MGEGIMGESTMLFLLENIKGVIKSEILGFSKEDFERIRIEMERFRAILHDTDKFEEGEEGLKVLLQQVRETIQDCEDVLDEDLILQTHHHGYATFYKFHCCVKIMKGRYRLSSSLKGINMKIGLIAEEFKKQEENLKRIEQASQSNHARRQVNALILENSHLVGIEGPIEQLIGWIFNGNSDREVISLVAMGGMGKTTLAKQVYDEVKNHFEIHAWITVSQSLEERELLIDTVKELYRATERQPPQDFDSFQAPRMKQTIMDLLRSSYLIVFDDIQQLHEWNVIQHLLPTNINNGSRVIVTTQKNNIASYASLDHLDKVYHVKPLPPRESWELLCRKTLRRHEELLFYLQDICKCITRKCEGLPLAIVAIGGVLAIKSREIIEEWNMVCNNLGSEIHGLDQLKPLKTMLSLSFNDLPYYLKPCYLYISIFSKDRLIERARLVRLWIAEGFIAPQVGKTLEDVADHYFDELLNRNLIIPVRKTVDVVKKFRVHDLLWEFIVIKSRDQNFAIFVGKDQNVPWPDKIRRLSLCSMERSVQLKWSVSRLRSLFMFGVKEKLRLNVLFPDGLRFLKVFDFQRSHMKKFPVEIRNLSLLKYLCLRNTWVETIPSFIGELKNLETLDLKHSFVSELPIEILNLQRLRNILIYRTDEPYLHFHNKIGFKALANIGRLTSLQKLCFIEAANDGGALMQELGRLTQLRRLGILKVKREDKEAFCSNIRELVNLRALSITANDENETIDLQDLSPPLLIQRLYLKGRMEALPPWILSLHSLVRLHLSWSHLNDDPLVFLQDLPNLLHLELLQAFNGNTLHFRSKGFKKLRLLTIDEFEELQYFVVEEGAMPCVQKLNIQRCVQLRRVPTGIEHLTTLQALEFLDMPYELMMTLHPDGNEDEYQRVAFIHEVVFTYWEDNMWKVQSLASLRDGNGPAELSAMEFIESQSRLK